MNMQSPVDMRRQNWVKTGNNGFRSIQASRWIDRQVNSGEQSQVEGPGTIESSLPVVGIRLYTGEGLLPSSARHPSLYGVQVK